MLLGIVAAGVLLHAFAMRWIGCLWPLFGLKSLAEPHASAGAA